MFLRRNRSRLFRINHTFAGAQSQGQREEQQDAYAFSIIEGNPEAAARLLVVVADGVGGSEGGLQAASAAVQGFIDGFCDVFNKTSKDPEEEKIPATPLPCENAITNALEAGLAAANTAVAEALSERPEIAEGAGTTLLAVCVDPHHAFWTSVGDSPLFLFRGKQIKRLNADHSMRKVLADKVASGELDEAEIKTHPERNALLSALTGDEIAEVDAPKTPFSLKRRDVLLAASDGILTLDLKEMQGILRRGQKISAEATVKELLAAVKIKCNPTQDNTTAAALRID